MYKVIATILAHSRNKKDILLLWNIKKKIQMFFVGAHVVVLRIYSLLYDQGLIEPTTEGSRDRTWVECVQVNLYCHS